MSVEMKEAIGHFIEYLDDSYLKPDSPFQQLCGQALFGYLKSNPNIIFHLIKTIEEYQSHKKVKLHCVKTLLESTLQMFKQDHNLIRLGNLDISQFLGKVSKSMLPVKL